MLSIFGYRFSDSNLKKIYNNIICASSKAQNNVNNKKKLLANISCSLWLSYNVPFFILFKDNT